MMRRKSKVKHITQMKRKRKNEYKGCAYYLVLTFFYLAIFVAVVYIGVFALAFVLGIVGIVLIVVIGFALAVGAFYLLLLLMSWVANTVFKKPTPALSKIRNFIRSRVCLLGQRQRNGKNEITVSAGAPNYSYDSMDGHEFEVFCAYILGKNRFENISVTQGSGDHGIDILAEKDDVSYAIQCKCHSSNIGNAAIQQAHTGKSIYHKDIAVVLTNRYFTDQAKQEAQILGVKLWNRDKLNELIRNVN